MARYSDKVVNRIAGVDVPLEGAKIYVYDQDEALATLTDDGGGSLANPVTSDEYGDFYYNAADGLYSHAYYYGGKLRYRDEAVMVGEGLPLPDSVITALGTTGGASYVGTSDGSTVQAELDHGGNFIQSGTGAVARTTQDKLRDIVSVKDFGAVADATLSSSTGVATGTDNSAAFNAALATGKNVFVPAGKYALSSPVQIKFDGQCLYGHGTYTTQLIWTGTDDTENMIELWSGRRDLGGSPTKSGQRLTGFMLSGGVGCDVANLVWIEAGIFHSMVDDIRIYNCFADVAESFIKLAPTAGLSYPVNVCLRDIVMTGSVVLGNPAVPRGVWIESAIECFFERVAVFNVSDAWVLGSAGSFDTVSSCRFIDTHVEIGDRDNAANDATGLRIYVGSNLNFFACKINCGVNDDSAYSSVTDQTCVEFMGHASPDAIIRNINFWGCRFWQYALQDRALVYFNSDANVDKVLFDSPEIVGVTNTVGFLGQGADFDGGIEVRNPHFANMSMAAPLANMQGRRNITQDPGSLDTLAVTNFDMSDDDGSAFGLPVQVSCDVDRTGVHLSWYKTSATGLNKFSLWNLSPGTANLGSARFTRRIIPPEEIRARVSKNWDPNNMGVPNIGTSTTLLLPGVRRGDFVKAAFEAKTVGGMADVICYGHATADNTVTVGLFTPAAKNFGKGLVTVFQLAPTFDFIEVATYNPGALDPLEMEEVQVAVDGAEPGDFVEVAHSQSLVGHICWGEVTTSGNVAVYLFNASGSASDIASGTITVGVRKRHLVL